MAKLKFVKKIVCAAGACAMLAAAALPAFAAGPAPDTSEGKTTVYYTSENIVPGPNNAKWGVKIPATVTLTNYAVEAPGELTLVSLKFGKELKDLYQNLEVQTTVSSAHGFQFVEYPDTSAPTAKKHGRYEYQVDGTAVANGADLTKNFSLSHTTQNGKFVLKDQVQKEGKYMDTITFTFKQLSAQEIATP